MIGAIAVQELITKCLNRHAPLRRRKVKIRKGHWCCRTKQPSRKVAQTVQGVPEMSPTEENAEAHDKLKRKFKTRNKYHKKKYIESLRFQHQGPRISSKTTQNDLQVEMNTRSD